MILRIGMGLLVLALGCAAPAFGQEAAESVWEFYWLEAGMGAVGSLTGFALGTLSGQLGICNDPLLCALLGSWIGTAGTVIGTGSLMGVEGNLYLAPLGAVLGGGVGFLVDVTLSLVLHPKQDWFVSTHLLAGLAAALGYNIGARVSQRP